MKNSVILGMGVIILAGVITFVIIHIKETPGPGPTIAPSISITPEVTVQPSGIIRESGGCKVGGCSGQVCSDKDAITTCEFKAEYSCYHTAICERGKDGKCGWRETEELTNCIKNAGSNGIKAPVY